MSGFFQGMRCVDTTRVFTGAKARNDFAAMQGMPRLWKSARFPAAAVFAMAMTLAAQAQPDRWYQLSEQAEKLQEQGNDGAALPLEQQAEQVAEATWGPNDRHVALSSNMLGVLEMDLEKFSDAETNLQRALAIDTKAGAAESKDAATDLSNLGLLYQDEGKYAAAEPGLEQAGKMRSTGPLPRRVQHSSRHAAAI